MEKEIVLPKDDPQLLAYYGDLVELFPDAVFVRTGTVYRFKSKKLAVWFCDKMHQLFESRRSPVPFDMNQMAIDYHKGMFSLEEYMQFYQDIGYSLSGFIEAFGTRLDMLGKKDEITRLLRAKRRREKKQS